LRLLIRVLGVGLILVAAGAAVEVVHPKGLAGLWGDLAGGSAAPRADVAATPVQGTPSAPVEPTEPAPVEFWGPGATKELASADRDYDRGDFESAFFTYHASRVLASNQDERYRADRGIEKSVLAWAVVRGAASVAGKPADLAEQWKARVAAVEAAPSETAWLEAARWAAGAGLRDRLPYAVGQTLDAARTGGFVQAHLEDVAKSAGAKSEFLAAAMAARGIGKPAVVAKGSSGSRASPRTPAPPMDLDPAPADDGPSGIGGVNRRGIPFGRFSAATREKLRRAVGLQEKGALAYRGASPDSPNRVANRETALRLLKEARGVYLEAQAEDSTSDDLDERLRETMQMIAQLNKDTGVTFK
jgi:hypothetical protein